MGLEFKNLFSIFSIQKYGMSKSNQTLNILIQLILGAISILIAQYIIPGVHVADFFTAIVIAALLALLNITIKPILIILTIPITVLTLGLFLLAINAIIILLAAEIIPGFEIDGFWWALLFSFVLSLINSLLGVSLGSQR
ncbi:putative membrane protein [Aquiflexum balticum DSM 16537]|uniref:Putative membrane protein n=2 Tax=Aquiflexum TaxID=280472 RepID=A0A1W2H8J0_9BACT|nr:putative membrane protein [Aquiflexum balticum DSM 16537]